jgi:hypothetical protein
MPNYKISDHANEPIGTCGRETAGLQKCTETSVAKRAAKVRESDVEDTTTGAELDICCKDLIQVCCGTLEAWNRLLDRVLDKESVAAR